MKELLIKLASTIKADDVNDPAILAQVQQLLMVLEPAPAPLPQELVDQLSQLQDKSEMFQQAAQIMNATTPEQIEALADSMKEAGLLTKSEGDSMDSKKYSSLIEKLKKSGMDSFAEKVARFTKSLRKDDLCMSLNSHHDYRSALKHADSKHSPETYDLEKGEPSNKIRSVADSYAASKGMKLNHDVPTHDINPEHSKKIAQAYSEMKHDPNHPDVKRAYDALASETVDQLKHIRSNGLKISRIQPGQENPYKNGSKDLNHDITQNNHMYYYPTESGFGSSEVHGNHPLLKPTSESHDGHTLLANDAFRIVHDYFGHAKEGHTFGPKGEDNAWKHHMQMYSPEAQKALTSETRGQNSEVNFGTNGVHNRKTPSQTIYADQKAGLLPQWTMEHSQPEAPHKDEKLAASELGKAQGPCWDGYEKVPGKGKYEKGSCRPVKKKAKESKDLEKGQDENGNPIRGSNKRLQQAKIFGTKADARIDKKGVAHPKIPNANGERLSPQRRKMMNHIKQFVEGNPETQRKGRYNAEMTNAAGKRHESTGELKVKNPPVHKQSFDVFSEKGAKDERARANEIKTSNAKKLEPHQHKTKPLQEERAQIKAKHGKNIKDPKVKARMKEIKDSLKGINKEAGVVKRNDPKPDWRSGKIETQPNPDAAIHELAHLEQTPKNIGIKDHQTHMDKRVGEVAVEQKKYAQSKRVKEEIQPMSGENLLRRQMGLPATRPSKNKNSKKPVEQALDGSGPRFHRAKDGKGSRVDYDRSSHLLSPENKQRHDEITSGQLKFHPEKGWTESNSPDAKINARAANSGKPMATVTKLPAKSKPTKLAASEAARDEDEQLNKAMVAIEALKAALTRSKK